uniref:Odorant receptor n=1 Tax=Timema douglasi TaxID=61478 RepID=A0A7R8ZDL2_TIMDO|nr:unnamed protein product [Timema douglasi]
MVGALQTLINSQPNGGPSLYPRSLVQRLEKNRVTIYSCLDLSAHEPGARENSVARVNDLNIYSCLNSSCWTAMRVPGKTQVSEVTTYSCPNLSCLPANLAPGLTPGLRRRRGLKAGEPITTLYDRSPQREAHAAYSGTAPCDRRAYAHYTPDSHSARSTPTGALTFYHFLADDAQSGINHISSSLLRSIMENQKTQEINNKWLGTSIMALKFGGGWRVATSSRLYYGYSLLIFLLYGVYFVLTAIRIYQVKDDANHVISIINVSLFHAGAFLKTISVMLARKRMEALCVRLERNYHQMEQGKTLNDSPKVSDDIIRKMRLFNVSMIISVGISGIIWSLTTMAYSSEKSGKADCKRHLPPAYEITSIYLTFDLTLAYYLNIVVDSFFFTLIAHTSGQLQALTTMLVDIKNYILTSSPPINIREMDGTVVRTHQDSEKSYANFGVLEGNRIENMTQTHSIWKTRHFLKTDAELNRRLVKCVELHVEINSFAKEVGSIIGSPMVIEFGELTLMICFQLFESVTKEKTFFNTFKFINTAMVALSVLYIYCRLGENVKTWLSTKQECEKRIVRCTPESTPNAALITARTRAFTENSSRVDETVYDLDWFQECPTFKKTCLVILIRTHKPIVLQAGPFYTISLEAFLKVLNTAYSYFTIMMQIHKKG